MSAPTALYRRYRPDNFAEVIGQEHVTAPLMAALEKNRVNHAYLFSGPRGCGKTTSARILARCLNCEQGPTPTPCGVCDSCVELARGGTGSLDVIEIDAASHGGVDDARDLRERATFAPIRDRYKIFIIDEAHMVTSAGFNALLKIVEEPPEHIKFIFATTEPEKVIGTIRSRTHHYPFRLVPPEPLLEYLGQLCAAENVNVAPGVLSLVIRAGGGSVRDTLSVLDQLMAGAGPEGLDYGLAVDLLGYTHASLLDDVVEALAAGDSATVFKSVDKVIQTGHDPRRFVEDLLERFRDLIIVAGVPENAHAILRGVPEELINRMKTQAAQLGQAELSRAADVTNTAFNEMTGATSPRLHLELLGARLLLPGADSSVRGVAARLDQMERRLNYSGVGAADTQAVVAQNSAPQAHAPAANDFTNSPQSGVQSGGGLAAVRAQLAKAKADAGAKVESQRNTEPVVKTEEVAEPASPVTAPPVAAQPVTGQGSSAEFDPWQEPATASAVQQENSGGKQIPSWNDLPTPQSPVPVTPARQEPQASQNQAASQHSAPTAPNVETTISANSASETSAPVASPQGVDAAEPASPTAGSSGSGIEMIRRAWPEILNKLGEIRKASWILINQNVVPSGFNGNILRVTLPSTGLVQTFQNGGHADNLRQAINQVLGIEVQFDPTMGDASAAGSSAEPNPKAPAERPAATTQAAAPTTQRNQTQPTASEPQRAFDRPTAVASADAQAAAQPEQPTANPAPKQAAVAPQTEFPPRDPAETQQSSGRASQPVTEDPWLNDPWANEPPPEEPPHSEPPYDSYAGQQDQQFDAAHQQPQQTGQQTTPQTAASEPAAEPPAPYRPKVSPISAWTTGWDSPAAPETTQETAAENSSPKRSELLAAQLSGQQNGVQQNSAQDWGVSLGSVSRNQVADPGWGEPTAAPDWAQPAASPNSEPTQQAASDHSSAMKPDAGTPLGAPANLSDPNGQQPNGTPSETAAQNDSSKQLSSTASNASQSASPNALPGSSQSETRGDSQSQVPASAVNGQKLSMYQRLSNSPQAQAAKNQASKSQQPTQAASYVEDIPSPDDVTIEESGVAGQAAVERILGGQLIEERPLTRSN